MRRLLPRPFSTSDLRGAVRLVTGAVSGVADVVEGVHGAVPAPFGRRGRVGRVAGWAYGAVRWVTRGVGRSLDAALGAVGRGGSADGHPARDAVVAALNGAFGDSLAAQGNPLATPFQVRYGGRRLVLDTASVARAVADPRGVLLVQIHGLCMHDGQWGRGGVDPGAALADALGATRVAVRYNSGRHVSESGRDLAVALDALVAAWPRRVRRLVVVGHSMGGLVARSALHYAAEAGHAWPGLDAALVTLGTPHHGAPLERLGSLVDAFLGATRYTAPLAAVGQARSAGVTDLRFGNVVEEDWAGRGRFDRAPDARRPTPLPPGVACYVVAATTGDGRGGARDRTVGDGLVPLDSALGRHADPARDLGVPPERQWVAVGRSHLDLLSDDAVTARLASWLARPTPPDSAPGGAAPFQDRPARPTTTPTPS
ncbi:hypothetical protein [Rubrivirga litoralis]|uniref:GPI inositol-deacylase PGAP1-like alpha/beta domain-containing protein n=1 Tax=Rubrivirga litoralis TaxID=3075598 RepID=A0ABU3BUX6_9BACT|nr:hypothetical protein [Rubrivirga sp. F394]MDT0633089.1 hypothetical protein [Rubrivirga sp. F394]